MKAVELCGLYGPIKFNELSVQKGDILTDQPLSSGDQSKLLIFFIGLLPSVIFAAGLLPVMFLGFGLYMMKKNEDFSHIETAVKVFRGFMSLALIGFGIAGLYFGNTYLNNPYGYGKFELFVCVVGFIAALTYFILVRTLFLSPLRNHRDWIVCEGIFSSKPSYESWPKHRSQIDIMGKRKVGSFSVADELQKWIRLMEDGHVSKEEYEQARKKLLNET
mgnify:CR=1 FL=1|tara:strand:+ start:2431 stop:3087 length:657 start_codon:yes stop_codon:yes gene_type:complete